MTGTHFNPIVNGQSCGWRPENPVSTRRDRPVQLERYRLLFAALSGSFADASFSVAFRYPKSSGLRGPVERQNLSLRVLEPFDGAHGVLTLRRFHPANG